MSTQLVNREEHGRRIAQISGAISKINESSYIVRSKFRYDNIIATQSGWAYSCPDYACHNANACTYLQLNFIAIEVIMCRFSFDHPLLIDPNG